MAEPTRTKDPETGREILAYPDGSEKWADTGFFKRGPTNPASNPVLADPVAMQKQGQEIKLERDRQKIRDAIDSSAIRKGKIDKSKIGSGEGLFALVEQATDLAFEAKTPKGIEGVLKLLFQLTGILLTRHEGEKATPPRNGIYISPDGLLEVVRRLEGEITLRVEKAKAIDAEGR